MAVRYYGIGVGGQDPADVTVAASTTSSDIELAVDDTNVPRAGDGQKHDIAMALEAIRLKVLGDTGY